jgi:hypothetical protein
MDLPQLEQATIALSLGRVVELMEASDIDAAPILEIPPIDNTPLSTARGNKAKS